MSGKKTEKCLMKGVLEKQTIQTPQSITIPGHSPKQLRQKFLPTHTNPVQTLQRKIAFDLIYMTQELYIHVNNISTYSTMETKK